jgi:hypothetical protein
MTLLSSSERSHERWSLLSGTPPLLGFAPNQCALPPIYLSRVHSQGPKPPLVRRCQPPDPVPPSWFRTTMTAYSTQKSRVCCTSQPAKGSPRFMLPGTSAARRQPRYPLPLPATRFTPFEDFPSLAAVPHHCGRCPLAVTDHCRAFQLTEARRNTILLDRNRVGATVSTSLRRERVTRHTPSPTPALRREPATGPSARQKQRKRRAG